MTTWMAKKRKKNAALARTAAASGPVMLNVCVQMNGSGQMVPTIAIAPKDRTARLNTWLANRQASSAPRSALSSMYVGMNRADRIPPATSSYTMLGMLFATKYGDASGVSASANPVAHMRAKPVTRDSVVAVDIVTVERAIEGLLMAFLRVS